MRQHQLFALGLLGWIACGGGGSESTPTPDAAPTPMPDAPPTFTCGDGVLQAGEQCETDHDCSRRSSCAPDCSCVAFDPPPPDTTQVLIDDAYRAGRIDLGTALLYRA
jgi:hypothetical protein